MPKITEDEATEKIMAKLTARSLSKQELSEPSETCDILTEEQIAAIYCRNCGVHATADTLHEFTRDSHTASGYRNLHRVCKTAAEKESRKLRAFKVTLDFTTIPDGKGMELLQSLSDEAKKDYRSLEYYILHLLAKDRVL